MALKDLMRENYLPKKCQLNDDEVFYLQSRGLSEEASRNLLIDAFAAEIINKLPLPSLQHILKQCVACKV